MTVTPLIRVENLTKVYHLGQVEVHALRGVMLSLAQGEFIAVMGASGSGKSPFMNILGCVDRPTSGHYLLNGIDVSLVSPDERAEIRTGTGCARRWGRAKRRGADCVVLA